MRQACDGLSHLITGNFFSVTSAAPPGAYSWEKGPEPVTVSLLEGVSQLQRLVLEYTILLSVSEWFKNLPPSLSIVQSR